MPSTDSPTCRPEMPTVDRIVPGAALLKLISALVGVTPYSVTATGDCTASAVTSRPAPIAPTEVAAPVFRLMV